MRPRIDPFLILTFLLHQWIATMLIFHFTYEYVIYTRFNQRFEEVLRKFSKIQYMHLTR